MATEIKVILAQNLSLKGQSFESNIMHLGWDNQTKRVTGRVSLIIDPVPLEGPRLLIHFSIYEGDLVDLSILDRGF